MKTCAILIRSMGTGGIEKSLLNLLNYIENNLDSSQIKFDLYLLSSDGAFYNQIPRSIETKVFSGNNEISFYSHKAAYKKGFLFGIKRNLCAIISKIFSNKIFINKMLSKIPTNNKYDYVISFQNSINNKTLYYGPAEIAIHKFPNAKKILFIHSDFQRAGLNNSYILDQLTKFSKIVFVSKSCMNDFLKIHPAFKNKVCYVYNLQNYDQIKELSRQKLDLKCDNDYINLITVARLSAEKAHLRTLSILKRLKNEGIKFNYHIIGDGKKQKDIIRYINHNNLKDCVFTYGNQTNPYPFISKSDLFLLLSYHEAAPMVIEESYCLGVPVFSTETISVNEFISNKDFICQNDETHIYEKLKQLLLKAEKDKNVLKKGIGKCLSNYDKFKQFLQLFNL